MERIAAFEISGHNRKQARIIEECVGPVKARGCGDRPIGKFRNRIRGEPGLARRDDHSREQAEDGENFQHDEGIDDS